ncbi:hypothetical protein EPI10_004812 [Gossypium australe]|uniref:Uncharacterized protein n=1 Tax=Gossypium australe TaxID=47621 RepID=A0A5B6WMS7_9ROSI|nr:hypothetical protein EPI10_004812 [Gossypium australe]
MLPTLEPTSGFQQLFLFPPLLSGGFQVGLSSLPLPIPLHSMYYPVLRTSSPSCINKQTHYKMLKSEGWAKAGVFGVLLDVQLFKSITN